MNDCPWWHLNTDEVASRLETDLKRGLSQSEAERKLKAFGFNRLPEGKGVSALVILMRQFKSLIIGVLVFAAVISGFLGEWVDTVAIIVIVIVNALLGFIQEFRAEKSIAALRKLTIPCSKVLRDEALQEIPSHLIVPGDLIFLEAGDRTPADGRLVHGVQLASQEAALTGESLPVRKITEPLAQKRVGLADRKNMLFMGTSIARGRGEMIATATGVQTELGKIASMLSDAPESTTPLQDQLEQLGRRLVYIFSGVVVFVFFLGLLRGNHWSEMLMMSLSLAVAAIPEGLPAIVTVCLAVGVQKMAKRHVLMRRLSSVETLGCTNVICTDKTGTLTQNEMTVRKIWVSGRAIDVSGVGYKPEGTFKSADGEMNAREDGDLKRVLEIGVLCNNAAIHESEEGWRAIGDPTEAALLTAAGKAGVWKEVLEEEKTMVEEIPFDSDRKRMSVLRQTQTGLTVFAKGAPDILLARCSKILRAGETLPFDEELRQSALKVNEALAGEAFRVLAVAYRDVDASQGSNADDLECDLVFAGLFAMMDPPRLDVQVSIRACREAGIFPVMITGDHEETAMAVAKELQMTQPGVKSLTGAELETMSQTQLEAIVKDVAVYARVTAEHKLRIIRAWKKQNAVVAMTGDGINDAPAVKEADIGVAMGMTGTDVTKEVSDMVITDDHFSSIVNAVKEGRGIYDNISKFVKFLLIFNFAEILVLTVGMLIGFKDPAGKILIPFTAIQILWMNLVTDGLPAMALGMDPLDPKAMLRAPRRAGQSMFTSKFVRDLLFLSSVTALGSLVACYYGAKINAITAQTMTLTTLVMLEMVGIQFVRADYHVGFFSNRWLTAALLFTVFIQTAILYMPVTQRLFGVVALSLAQWGVIGCIVGVTWVFVKAIRGLKLLGRREP